jgi:hypothetical protein
MAQVIVVAVRDVVKGGRREKVLSSANGGKNQYAQKGARLWLTAIMFD